MSSDSDRVAFDESVSPQDNSNLFQAKKWTYITDSTSSAGVFTGQIQFDLGTLSSQNQWTDLSQAYVQFPVKLTITSPAAIASGAFTNSVLAATIKNGFHNFVDSVQIVLGSTTIQSSQIYQNIDTSYKILSEWSQDELLKYGPSLGLALDDYELGSDASLTTRTGLNNVAINTLSPTYRGVSYPIDNNPGFKTRALMQNSSTISTTAATTILGNTNCANSGKSRVQFVATTPLVTTAGQELYAQFALATVRLKDISDAVSKLPLIKGMKGFIYINYNSAQTTYTTDTNGALSAAPTSSQLFGRCQPGMLNPGAVTHATGGSLQFKCEVSGALTTGTALTDAIPTFNNARLFAPYYIANPEVDRALTMKKTIRYNERFVTSFDIAAGQSYTGTITPGISNPKRLILVPRLTGSAAAGPGVASFQVEPLLSPWDACPVATSPFAGLKDLQVYVGNSPAFQSPITMNYEMFLQEVAQQGVDGGLKDQQASGLLSQRMWDQMYRYYTVDIGRRMNSEDGASKSVQVQCNNPTIAAMKVIAILWFEREISIDTALGQVSQSM